MIPADYEDRVYAGVLGKVIAVYLGRPFEGWRYQRIVDELGDITYYVNDRMDLPLKNHLLVVTDDDISGTLVFPRALRDHGVEPTSEQVGQTWLDQIVEEQTVLWWGGLGNSTEHTAYLRMKAGILPPDSGAMARNGQVVAEQVGAQIFVEGFAMTRPGDPQAAADLAERAARVSHDGEAIHAARVVAALVAQSFVEPDMDRLLDTAVTLIPKDSLIYRVVADVREWATGGDWKATRERIEERYGYHLYGGNCHVIPNHATIINALAHSGGEFAQAMTVVNTSGWDTDSNAGNVGAICGVRGGLAGLDAGPDWRGPIADRLYLPAADGGSCITDAAREALTLAGHGRTWAGERPVVPKDGARFHFAFPGSVQGFAVAEGNGQVVNHDTRLTVPGATTVSTPTFIPPEALDMPIYGLLASPTLYTGQTVTAHVDATDDAEVRLTITAYDENDELRTVSGPGTTLSAGESAELAFTVPELGGQPVAAVGLTTSGTVQLDRLTWDGAPDVTLTRPVAGTVWRRAWLRAVDRWDGHWPEPFRIVQNRGTGLLSQGSRDWQNYTVTADVTPHLAASAGIAARVQGLQRYYALELADRNTVRLVRHHTVLASRAFDWEYGHTYRLALTVDGDRLVAAVDGEALFDLTDPAYDCGGVALVVTEGRTATQEVRITPISREEES
ncbi:ADP-ribosylglycohydrolase family protein [Kribbella sp. NPDC049227]|uniref:ADP-ribosylglycohydrolase family protein n=1 Tax=Kribbella sp. NPDC049227 TaxID=3364113 RepID=UPI00371C66D3